MDTKVVISLTEASNKIALQIDESNSKFDSIVNRITDMTADLVNQSCTNQDKYDTVVSIEYLLLKARLDTEFEHLKIKSILSNPETPASLRGLFMKRDQYLAQVVLKLNSIRDDVSVLQKTVYTQSTRTLK